eukprot:GEMP01064623.1.p1 GENE.GEMP01064623.1~~GEMP01064623.1.p1  ORF type:complete len:258 (+),score=56.56 GEMP01064623.1:113-886(+)
MMDREEEIMLVFENTFSPAFQNCSGHQNQPFREYPPRLSNGNHNIGAFLFGWWVTQGCLKIRKKEPLPKFPLGGKNKDSMEEFETARKRLREIREIVDEPDKKSKLYEGLKVVMNMKDAHRDMISVSDENQMELQKAMNDFGEAKINLVNEEFHVLWMEQVIRQCDSEDLSQFKKASGDWDTIEPFPAVLNQLREELAVRHEMEGQLKDKNARNTSESKTLDLQKKLPKTTLDMLASVEASLETLKNFYETEQNQHL